jgi:hypothetical protein
VHKHAGVRLCYQLNLGIEGLKLNEAERSIRGKRDYQLAHHKKVEDAVG